jgi:hypothetical protein
MRPSFPVRSNANRWSLRVLRDVDLGTSNLVEADIADDAGEVSTGDRPIAPGDLPRRHLHPDADLASDLQARIAELDAVAWNLPSSRANAPTARDEGDVSGD